MSQNKDIIQSSNLEEAINKIQEIGTKNPKKFIESVDIAINLGIDPKQSDQAVKGSLLLPSGSGKEVKIIVFAADEDTQKLALDTGASLAGLEELISKIEGGFLDFDCCIATPDVMQKISKIARKLGPRGLMPSPKNGTVTKDVKKAVEDALKGKVDFRNDKGGIVHCSIGKINFKTTELLENINAVLKAIKDAKPENSKGKYIKNFYINSTMGPAIQVRTDSL